MLIRKMLRDMGRHKTQFISIFLMAFLAVYIYAGVGGEWIGLRRSSDSYYEKVNLSDIWLYSSSFTQEQADKLLDTAHITQIERRLELDVTAKLEDNPHISLYFLEKNEISVPYVLEGAAFDLGDKDGVWLDKRFSDARGLKTGDSITFTYNGMEFEKRIRGLVYSAEYVYMSGGGGLTPDFSEYGYAFLSDRAFPVPDMLVYTTVLIKTDTEDIRALEDSVSAVLDGKYSVFLERANHPSVNMFANETNQHKMMGGIFPVVFLAIALLTMMTTMTRIVSAQQVQIGTLKALGFGRGTIIRHYMSYGFWLSLAGSLLGIAAGPLTLPRLFYPSMSGFYTMPDWTPAFDISFFVMAAAVVALCSLVTYITCRRLLAGTPAQALRPKAPKAFRHGLLEKSAVWHKLGFNLQWNLRDMSRNRVRSLMAVIGVFGCTALLICAFGMNDGMNDLKSWQYEDINRFESKLLISDTASPEQTEQVRLETDGELLMEGSVEIKAGGIKKAGSVTVTDNVSLIAPTDMDRKHISLPDDGVSMTYKMAQALGVKEGDEISWHIYGSEEWTSSAVAAIYREPTNQGISLSRGHFEALGYTFRPTAILSAKRIDGGYDGISSVLSTSAITSSWDELTQAMMTMVYILILAAAVLSVVVLYNLGLLSFTEMEREMATLKVMGLKTKKLRRLLLTQNLWFSAIGFILGIPSGMALVQVIVSSSGEFFDFPVMLHLTNLALSFVITFGLSVLVNLLFSKKIKRINMVEALKGSE